MFLEEVRIVKGYTIGDGYLGLVDGEYMLFVSEEEYREYLQDRDD